MKTNGKLFEAYFPDTDKLVYEKNRKACDAKFKLDNEMKFIQFAEAKILRDGGHLMKSVLYQAPRPIWRCPYSYQDTL